MNTEIETVNTLAAQISESSSASKISEGTSAQAIQARVAAMVNEASGVVSIRLEPVNADKLPAWMPGAHIDVQIDANLLRQYSLCGDSDDEKQWRIAVLRETASRGGSEAIHTRLKCGDIVSVSAPRNNFPLIDAEEYIFVAGGIGITPILPMLRVLERKGKSWKLLYGGRSRASMAFLDELTMYGDKVVVRPEDQYGLLDLASWIGQPKSNCLLYVCGPERLIQAMEQASSTWPAGSLHLERFKPVSAATAQQDAEFEVVLKRTGITVQVGANETIAAAVEKAGLYIPRSCNEGICGTCLTKVLEGMPDHRDSFLRPKMRAENKHILVCCSRSLTPKLVLDI